jgi:hypothetical protein
MLERMGASRIKIERVTRDRRTLESRVSLLSMYMLKIPYICLKRITIVFDYEKI